MKREDGSIMPFALAVLYLIGLVGMGTMVWLQAQITESNHALAQTKASSALGEYAQHVVQEANVAGITAARKLGPTTYAATQEKVTLNGITVTVDGSLRITETATTTFGRVTAVSKTVVAPLAGIGAYLGKDSSGQATYAGTGTGVPAVAIWTLDGKED